MWAFPSFLSYFIFIEVCQLPAITEKLLISSEFNSAWELRSKLSKYFFSNDWLNFCLLWWKSPEFSFTWIFAMTTSVLTKKNRYIVSGKNRKDWDQTFSFLPHFHVRLIVGLLQNFSSIPFCKTLLLGFVFFLHIQQSQGSQTNPRKRAAQTTPSCVVGCIQLSKQRYSETSRTYCSAVISLLIVQNTALIFILYTLAYSISPSALSRLCPVMLMPSQVIILSDSLADNLDSVWLKKNPENRYSMIDALGKLTSEIHLILAQKSGEKCL